MVRCDKIPLSVTGKVNISTFKIILMTKCLLPQLQLSLTTDSVSKLTHFPPPVLNNKAVVLGIYNHCKALGETRVNSTALHHLPLKSKNKTIIK